MIFADKILNFLTKLSRKDFIRMLVAIISIVVLVSSALIYYFYYKKSYVTAEIKKIYTFKADTQKYIVLKKEIESQKEALSKNISENSKFKLVDFFDNIKDSLRLNNSIESTNIKINNIANSDYNEINLEISIKNINTKQLVDLMASIEESTRVYIKNITIKKANKLPAIDVGMTITTLQSKSD